MITGVELRDKKNSEKRISSPYLGPSRNVSVAIPEPLYVFNQSVNEPVECVARQRTAIIIPYRNRAEQLAELLAHLNPILKRQQIEYQVFCRKFRSLLRGCSIHRCN